MSDNILAYDALSATQYIRTTNNAGVHTPHNIIDSMPEVTTAVRAFPVQHIDSFSRMRTSDPGYRFDSQFTNGIDSDLWDTRILDDGATGDVNDGTVAHDATDRLAVLTAKAGAEGVRQAILQSHYHSPYTSGRGQLALITGVLGAAPVAGGEVGMGYFDGTNGAYLRRDDVGIYVGITTSTNAADQEVEQEFWNIDPLDGSGPSGITLDLDLTQILAVPLQALYVGRALIAFDIDGELIPVHQFLHANVIAAPYIAQASLPVRYWATATNTASDVSMKAICCSVISEGGANLQDIPGRPFVSTGQLTGAAAGTLLVIRCKAQLNSINQNAVCIPTDLDVTVAGASCWIEVRRNATVSAGTFTDVGPLSTMEESFAGNVGTDPVVTAGTGTLIDRKYVPASASVRSNKVAGLLGKTLLAYSHLLGAGDTLSVIWNGGNGSTDVFGSVNWKEVR